MTPPHDASAPAAVHLLLPTGEMLDLPPTASWVIGRATPRGPPVDINLTPYGASEHGVSRQHARICQTAAGCTIEDLGSHNETSLNNARISIGQCYPLADGDHILLGVFRLVFVIDT